MPLASRIAALFCVFAVVTIVVAQPSLRPPVGAIDESGRFGTRIEVNSKSARGDAGHAFIIDQPGSYYLSGNIDAGSLSGIQIASDNVTLDLNGYTISGSGTAGVVVPTAGQSDTFFDCVVVRNGVIDGFVRGINGSLFVVIPGQGAVVSEFRGIVVEDVLVSNVQQGILLNKARVHACTIHTQAIGIQADESLITDSTVYFYDSAFNSKTGIEARRSTISRCAVDASEATVDVDLNCFVIDRSQCDACSCTGLGTGFDVISDSVVTGCASFNAIRATLNPLANVFNSNF